MFAKLLALIRPKVFTIASTILLIAAILSQFDDLPVFQKYRTFFVFAGVILTIISAFIGVTKEMKPLVDDLLTGSPAPKWLKWLRAGGIYVRREEFLLLALLLLTLIVTLFVAHAHSWLTAAASGGFLLNPLKDTYLPSDRGKDSLPGVSRKNRRRRNGLAILSNSTALNITGTNMSPALLSSNPNVDAIHPFPLEFTVTKSGDGYRVAAKFIDHGTPLYFDPTDDRRVFIPNAVAAAAGTEAVRCFIVIKAVALGREIQLPILLTIGGQCIIVTLLQSFVFTVAAYKENPADIGNPVIGMSPIGPIIGDSGASHLACSLSSLASVRSGICRTVVAPLTESGYWTVKFRTAISEVEVPFTLRKVKSMTTCPIDPAILYAREAINLMAGSPLIRLLQYDTSVPDYPWAPNAKIACLGALPTSGKPSTTSPSLSGLPLSLRPESRPSPTSTCAYWLDDLRLSKKFTRPVLDASSDSEKVDYVSDDYDPLKYDPLISLPINEIIDDVPLWFTSAIGGDRPTSVMPPNLVVDSSGRFTLADVTSTILVDNGALTVIVIAAGVGRLSGQSMVFKTTVGFDADNQLHLFDDDGNDLGLSGQGRPRLLSQLWRQMLALDQPDHYAQFGMLKGSKALFTALFPYFGDLRTFQLGSPIGTSSEFQVMSSCRKESVRNMTMPGFVSFVFTPATIKDKVLASTSLVSPSFKAPVASFPEQVITDSGAQPIYLSKVDILPNYENQRPQANPLLVGVSRFYAMGMILSGLNHVLENRFVPRLSDPNAYCPESVASLEVCQTVYDAVPESSFVSEDKASHWFLSRSEFYDNETFHNSLGAHFSRLSQGFPSVGYVTNPFYEDDAMDPVE